MKLLDLFSGIGGFSLGLERAGFETVAFCEIEDFPRKVLAKHWPDVPCASDVTKLTYKDGALYDDGREIYRGSVDVVCGGFPCQDLSTAGRQAGLSASRSGLFYEMCRVISECRPKFAIFENVTNLLNGGGGDWFTEVLCEISSLGYDAEWHCIPASELGAHHHRDRVWIVAYPSELFSDGGKDNTREFMERGEIPKSGNCCGEADVADTTSIRQQGQGKYEQSIFAKAYKEGKTVNAIAGGTPNIWKAEPDVGGRLDGFSSWLDGIDVGQPHQLLLADGEKEKRARKELYALWLSDAAEAIWWQVRGLRGISAEGVLFTYLRQFKKRGADQAWLQLARQETPKEELRGVWTEYIASRAPHRSKYKKQQPREYTNPMQTLSQLLAYDAEKAWVRYCRENAVPSGWEEGISRVADQLPDRTHRLKSLGNAVVPQIPEVIGRAIMEAEK